MLLGYTFIFPKAKLLKYITVKIKQNLRLFLCTSSEIRHILPFLKAFRSTLFCKRILFTVIVLVNCADVVFQMRTFRPPLFSSSELIHSPPTPSRRCVCFTAVLLILALACQPPAASAALLKCFTISIRLSRKLRRPASILSIKQRPPRDRKGILSPSS